MSTELLLQALESSVQISMNLSRQSKDAIFESRNNGQIWFYLASKTSPKLEGTFEVKH